jgi:hypothetical protein
VGAQHVEVALADRCDEDVAHDLLGNAELVRFVEEDVDDHAAGDRVEDPFLSLGLRRRG